MTLEIRDNFNTFNGTYSLFFISMYCVLYGSLRTVGNLGAMVFLRNMNREYIAGPFKLDLELLASSIGGCLKQSTLKESMFCFQVFNIEIAATGCQHSVLTLFY